jgi:hypothetical protein
MLHCSRRRLGSSASGSHVAPAQSSIGFQPVFAATPSTPDRQDAYATLLMPSADVFCQRIARRRRPAGDAPQNNFRFRRQNRNLLLWHHRPR